MKRIIRLPALFIAQAFIISCGGSQGGHEHEHAADTTVAVTATPETPGPVTTETSVYTGMLPCANCSGIETEITLNGDYTYQLHLLYHGKESAGAGSNEVNETGKWMLHGSDTIHLHDVKDRPALYIRTDSTPIQLDMSGKRIEGHLADKYVLRKIK
jgi:uncharacterized lipoprotein NlpE involved in copper resistance